MEMLEETRSITLGIFVGEAQCILLKLVHVFGISPEKLKLWTVFVVLLFLVISCLQSDLLCVKWGVKVFNKTI